MSNTPTTNEPKQSVCLYFGSFNPIHRGHLALATYALHTLAFDEVWLMLSPLNPQKRAKDQLSFDFRVRLIREAIKLNSRLRLCLYEQSLPLPHYTIRTIRSLELLHPTTKFSLLIGGDNLAKINSWFEYQRLLSRLPLYVYPRPEATEAEDLVGQLEQDGHANITYCTTAPLIPISSTEIREAALRGMNLSSYLPNPELWEFFVEEIRGRNGCSLKNA